MVCSIGHQGQPFLLFKIGGGDHKGVILLRGGRAGKITLLMTRLGLKSARHADLLAVILAVADPTCLAWRGQKNYFRPTTHHIVGAFVRLGALEPLHPNADEWLLQGAKHGGEDWDAVVRDPAFDALRRGRNVPDVESGARAARGRGPRRGSRTRTRSGAGAAAGASGGIRPSGPSARGARSGACCPRASPRRHYRMIGGAAL